MADIGQAKMRSTKLGLACAVQIAGSWSPNWEPQPCQLNEEGKWEIEVDLLPGVYEYKYKFNDVWVLDTTKPTTRNFLGTENNVLIVEKKAEETPLQMEPKKSSFKEPTHDKVYQFDVVDNTVKDNAEWERRITIDDQDEGKKKKSVSFGHEDNIPGKEDDVPIAPTPSAPIPVIGTSFSSILKQVGRYTAHKEENPIKQQIKPEKKCVGEEIPTVVVDIEVDSLVKEISEVSKLTEIVPSKDIAETAESDENSVAEINVSEAMAVMSGLLSSTGNNFVEEKKKIQTKCIGEENFTVVDAIEVGRLVKEITDVSKLTELLPCDPVSNDRVEIPTEYKAKQAESDGKSTSDIKVSEPKTVPSDSFSFSEENFIENVSDSCVENELVQEAETSYELILEQTYTQIFESIPEHMHLTSFGDEDKSNTEDKSAVSKKCKDVKTICEDFVDLSNKYDEITNIFEEFLTEMTEESHLLKPTMTCDQSLYDSGINVDLEEFGVIQEDNDVHYSPILYLKEESKTSEQEIIDSADEINKKEKSEKFLSYIDDIYYEMKQRQNSPEPNISENVNLKIKESFSSYINDVYETIKYSSPTEHNSALEIREKLMNYVDYAYSIIKTRQEEKYAEDKTKEVHDKFFSYIDDVYNDLKRNKEDSFLKKEEMEISEITERTKDTPEPKFSESLETKEKLLKYVDDAYNVMRTRKEGTIGQEEAEKAHDYAEEEKNISQKEGITKEAPQSNYDDLMKYIDDAYLIIKTNKADKLAEQEEKRDHEKCVSKTHRKDTISMEEENKNIESTQKIENIQSVTTPVELPFSTSLVSHFMSSIKTRVNSSTNYRTMVSHQVSKTRPVTKWSSTLSSHCVSLFPDIPAETPSRQFVLPSIKCSHLYKYLDAKFKDNIAQEKAEKTHDYAKEEQKTSKIEEITEETSQSNYKDLMKYIDDAYLVIKKNQTEKYEAKEEAMVTTPIDTFLSTSLVSHFISSMKTTVKSSSNYRTMVSHQVSKTRPVTKWSSTLSSHYVSLFPGIPTEAPISQFVLPSIQCSHLYKYLDAKFNPKLSEKHDDAYNIMKTQNEDNIVQEKEENTHDYAEEENKACGIEDTTEKAPQSNYDDFMKYIDDAYLIIKKNQTDKIAAKEENSVIIPIDEPFSTSLVSHFITSMKPSVTSLTNYRTMVSHQVSKTRPVSQWSPTLSSHYVSLFPAEKTQSYAEEENKTSEIEDTAEKALQSNYDDFMKYIDDAYLIIKKNQTEKIAAKEENSVITPIDEPFSTSLVSHFISSMKTTVNSSTNYRTMVSHQVSKTRPVSKWSSTLSSHYVSLFHGIPAETPIPQFVLPSIKCSHLYKYLDAKFNPKLPEKHVDAYNVMKTQNEDNVVQEKEEKTHDYVEEENKTSEIEDMTEKAPQSNYDDFMKYIDDAYLIIKKNQTDKIAEKEEKIVITPIDEPFSTSLVSHFIGSIKTRVHSSTNYRTMVSHQVSKTRPVSKWSSTLSSHYVTLFPDIPAEQPRSQFVFPSIQCSHLYKYLDTKFNPELLEKHVTAKPLENIEVEIKEYNEKARMTSQQDHLKQQPSQTVSNKIETRTVPSPRTESYAVPVLKMVVVRNFVERKFCDIFPKKTIEDEDGEMPVKVAISEVNKGKCVQQFLEKKLFEDKNIIIDYDQVEDERKLSLDVPELEFVSSTKNEFDTSKVKRTDFCALPVIQMESIRGYFERKFCKPDTETVHDETNVENDTLLEENGSQMKSNSDSLEAMKVKVDEINKKIKTNTDKSANILSQKFELDIREIYYDMKLKKDLAQIMKPEDFVNKIKQTFTSYINEIFSLLGKQTVTEEPYALDIRNRLISYIENGYIAIKEWEKEGLDEDVYKNLLSYIDMIYLAIKTNRQPSPYPVEEASPHTGEMSDPQSMQVTSIKPSPTKKETAEQTHELPTKPAQKTESELKTSMTQEINLSPSLIDDDTEEENIIEYLPTNLLDINRIDSNLHNTIEADYEFERVILEDIQTAQENIEYSTEIDQLYGKKTAHENKVKDQGERQHSNLGGEGKEEDALKGTPTNLKKEVIPEFGEIEPDSVNETSRDIVKESETGFTPEAIFVKETFEAEIDDAGRGDAPEQGIDEMCSKVEGLTKDIIESGFKIEKSIDKILETAIKLSEEMAPKGPMMSSVESSKNMPHEVELKDSQTTEEETVNLVHVSFEWDEPGQDVSVAGDFSSWQPLAMKKSYGVWRIGLKLKPGRYTYRFVVDGLWVTKEGAALEDDGTGNFNCLLVIDMLETLNTDHQEMMSEKIETDNKLVKQETNIKGIHDDKTEVLSIWETHPSALNTDDPKKYKEAEPETVQEITSKLIEKDDNKLEIELTPEEEYTSDCTPVKEAGPDADLEPHKDNFEKGTTKPSDPSSLHPQKEYFSECVKEDTQRVNIDEIYDEEDSKVTYILDANYEMDESFHEELETIVIEADVELEWDESGQDVSVAGNFSSWQPLSMIKTDGVWRIELKLKPGRYAYKFIVDGVWVNKENTELEDDGIGNFNRPLIVEMLDTFDVKGDTLMEREIGNKEKMAEEEIQKKDVEIIGEVHDSPEQSIKTQTELDRHVLTEPFIELANENIHQKYIEPIEEIHDIADEAAVSLVPVSLEWDESGQDVSVAGDFSSWQPLSMNKTDATWRIVLSLKPGRYTYKFVVDGVWVNTKGTRLEDDGTGNFNCLLIVEMLETQHGDKLMGEEMKIEGIFAKEGSHQRDIEIVGEIDDVTDQSEISQAQLDRQVPHEPSEELPKEEKQQEDIKPDKEIHDFAEGSINTGSELDKEVPYKSLEDTSIDHVRGTTLGYEKESSQVDLVAEVDIHNGFETSSPESIKIDSAKSIDDLSTDFSSETTKKEVPKPDTDTLYGEHESSIEDMIEAIYAMEKFLYEEFKEEPDICPKAGPDFSQEVKPEPVLEIDAEIVDRTVPEIEKECTPEVHSDKETKPSEETAGKNIEVVKKGPVDPSPDIHQTKTISESETEQVIDEIYTEKESSIEDVIAANFEIYKYIQEYLADEKMTEDINIIPSNTDVKVTLNIPVESSLECAKELTKRVELEIKKIQNEPLQETTPQPLIKIATEPVLRAAFAEANSPSNMKEPFPEYIIDERVQDEFVCDSGYNSLKRTELKASVNMDTKHYSLAEASYSMFTPELEILCEAESISDSSSDSAEEKTIHVKAEDNISMVSHEICGSPCSVEDIFTPLSIFSVQEKEIQPASLNEYLEQKCSSVCHEIINSHNENEQNNINSNTISVSSYIPSAGHNIDMVAHEVKFYDTYMGLSMNSHTVENPKEKEMFSSLAHTLDLFGDTLDATQISPAIQQREQDGISATAYQSTSPESTSMIIHTTQASPVVEEDIISTVSHNATFSSCKSDSVSVQQPPITKPDIISFVSHSVPVSINSTNTSVGAEIKGDKSEIVLLTDLPQAEAVNVAISELCMKTMQSNMHEMSPRPDEEANPEPDREHAPEHITEETSESNIDLNSESSSATMVSSADDSFEDLTGDVFLIKLEWEGAGEVVSVAGDFNHWQPLPLEKTDGIWTVYLSLSPGKYTYKFVVDGVWVIKEGTELEDDGNGNFNCLLVVKKYGEEKKGEEAMNKIEESISTHAAMIQEQSRETIQLDDAIQDVESINFTEDLDISIEAFSDISIEDLACDLLDVNLVWEGEGDDVSVAGDFSIWQLLPLKKTDGVWRIQLQLKPGKYMYRFFDNGVLVNKEGTELEMDGNGNFNCILIVEKTGEEITHREVDKGEFEKQVDIQLVPVEDHYLGEEAQKLKEQTKESKTKENIDIIEAKDEKKEIEIVLAKLFEQYNETESMQKTINDVEVTQDANIIQDHDHSQRKSENILDLNVKEKQQPAIYLTEQEISLTSPVPPSGSGIYTFPKNARDALVDTSTPVMHRSDEWELISNESDYDSEEDSDDIYCTDEEWDYIDNKKQPATIPRKRSLKKKREYVPEAILEKEKSIMEEILKKDLEKLKGIRSKATDILQSEGKSIIEQTIGDYIPIPEESEFSQGKGADDSNNLEEQNIEVIDLVDEEALKKSFEEKEDNLQGITPRKLPLETHTVEKKISSTEEQQTIRHMEVLSSQTRVEFPWTIKIMNNWSGEPIDQVIFDDGEIIVDLPKILPGSYEFKFLINGCSFCDETLPFEQTWPIGVPVNTLKIWPTCSPRVKVKTTLYLPWTVQIKGSWAQEPIDCKVDSDGRLEVMLPPLSTGQHEFHFLINGCRFCDESLPFLQDFLLSSNLVTVSKTGEVDMGKPV